MTAPAPPPTQGPAWLAELLYSSPAWLDRVLSLVGVVAVALVGWRLWTDGPPDAQAQEQMGTILVTAVAVASATIWGTEADIGAYGFEVVLGVVIGYLVTTVGKELGRLILRQVIAAERRTACAWLSLSALLWTPLAIVPSSERTMLLRSIILWGLLVSVGMALVMAHEEF
jgi:hypothetical protein